jgi:type II secretory pathway pseudopilin PulG
MSGHKRIRQAGGFALIDLVFVCGMIGLLSSIALPKFVLAKQAAGAASALASLRTVNSAELTFALTCGSGFYAPDLRTLGTPPPGSNEAFISPDLGASNIVQKSSYTFRLEAAPYPGAPPSCNGLTTGETAQGFRAAADPTEPLNIRFFGSNANGQIYEDVVTLWNDMPETGEPLVGAPLR